MEPLISLAYLYNYHLNIKISYSIIFIETIQTLDECHLCYLLLLDRH